MSGSNCCFLSCIQVSQEADNVVWYSYLFKNIPQIVVIHTVKGLCHSQWSRSGCFLEFLCFFYDPVHVGSLISGSSAFSKSSLYIWKFSVHILLKPGLKDFERYLTSMRNKCSCTVVWTVFGIAMKTDIFQSCDRRWVFQICRHTEYSTLTASSFRIWNSLSGIPSPPLALFIIMLPKAHLSSPPGCLPLDEWPQHCGYPDH